MNTNDTLARAKQKMRQAKQKQILKENREKKAKEDLDFRRKIIIGELFLQYFPNLQNFTPQINREANKVEFAALEQMLEALSQYQIAYRDMENECLNKQEAELD